MKGFAYVSQGKSDWIEKERPLATGSDAVVRPLVVSPCTSDVHNVECGYVEPGRILGHKLISIELVMPGIMGEKRCS